MELKQEIKSSLRQVIEKEKWKIYHTGELRVIDLAKDCLEAIEQLEKDATAYRELMIPFKPNDIKHVPNVSDPYTHKKGKCKCGSVVTQHRNYYHCDTCGQKLDWESEGE